MTDYGYQLRFLKAAEPELKDYLLSDNVYWNLSLSAEGGMPPYPQFSMGWLLLFRRQLTAAGSQPEFAEVLEAIDATRDRWRSAWGRKAAREFGDRLNQWARFISEYGQDPPGSRPRYRYEVQRRTMLALLEPEADGIPAEQLDLLAELDAVLRSFLQPGAFIEDEALRAAFPEGEFWFLYGELK